MASPQKENGFTPIANEILEALARYPLNGTQWRILMVIFRYTYGFNRKTHGLSETFISKATGIHRKQIQRELNGLIACKIVSFIDNATFNSPRKLAFNKDHSIWVVTNKLPGSEKEDTANQLPGSQLEAHTGSELVPSPGSELASQERKNINKIRNKSICPFSEIQNLFNTICKSLPAVQKMTDSRKEKLSKGGLKCRVSMNGAAFSQLLNARLFSKGRTTGAGRPPSIGLYGMIPISSGCSKVNTAISLWVRTSIKISSLDGVIVWMYGALRTDI